MSTILYGIPNCDSVKKARKWLDANNVAYQFHDFRKDGLSSSLLDQWLKLQSWEVLLNKRGTTWRQLPEQTKLAINETNARNLMLENPTLIKRPVVSHNKALLVGFQEKLFKQEFSV